MNLGRFFHTVRHLRPVQITGRLRHRLVRPRPDLRLPPPSRAMTGAWRPWVWRKRSWLGDREFAFLNSAHRVANPADWDHPAWPKLWRYNLHYFDCLHAADDPASAAEQAALIAAWIHENPPGLGSGWEPYPVSLRIVNWIKWSLRRSPDFSPVRAQSLAVQARWLRRRLESHLLGNHLWANAKALLFAGVWFDGPESEVWLREGAALLAQQLQEQILADGGHFERSPMYQATLLEDLLDVLNLAHAYPGVLPASLLDAVGSRAIAMGGWLQVMSHPDGGIAFFNDAAFGIAAAWAGLSTYASLLGLGAAPQPADGVTLLADSGYARLQRADAVVLCDVAPLGPDFLPAHGHADTLAFELSLCGHRVFVNTGTSVYAPGPERLRQRGTAAHNTVEVDGADSSEVWDAFRVARRARPLDVRSGASDQTIWLQGGHDGYRRLPGAVVHWRRWELGPGRLVLFDRLDGQPRHATAFLLLHPGVEGSAVGAGAVTLRVAGREVRCRWPDAARVTCERAEWCPEFGRTQPTRRLRVDFAGHALTTEVLW